MLWCVSGVHSATIAERDLIQHQAYSLTGVAGALRGAESRGLMTENFCDLGMQQDPENADGPPVRIWKYSFTGSHLLACGSWNG